MDIKEYYDIISHRKEKFTDYDENNLEEVKTELAKMQKLWSLINQVFEESKDCLYITDNEGKAVWINHAYERITGHNRENLLGKTGRFLEENNMINRSGAVIAITKNEPVTIKQFYPNGKNAMVTSTPVYDEEKNIIFTMNNVRDLTEIERMEKFLERNADKLKEYKAEIEELKRSIIDYEFVAQDPKMIDVFMLARRISIADSNILITGETGTGKEVVASYIQRKSRRNTAPFVQINCGAIPESLFESELFGYEKGAFTGASSSGKKGLLEVANGGTLFLDEVGEMPLSMQVKLLRAIQERKIRRVGGDRDISIDVRIISATNKNLEEMAFDGRFRQDLYYRLNVVPVVIPPLRDRVGDIVPLANAFLKENNEKYGFTKSFSADAYKVIMTYSWPGNVRELRNVIERTIVMSEDPQHVIQPGDIALPKKHRIADNMRDIDDVPMKQRLEIVEYEYMLDAMNKFHDSKTAADYLGMSAPTFCRKKKYYEQIYADRYSGKKRKGKNKF